MGASWVVIIFLTINIITPDPILTRLDLYKETKHSFKKDMWAKSKRIHPNSFPKASLSDST